MYKVIIVLFILSTAIMAESLNDISKFAKEICGSIEKSGKEKNQKLELKGKFDSKLLSKIGINVNTNGIYSRKEKEYNGLYLKDLPKELKSIRQCKQYVIDKFDFSKVTKLDNISDVNQSKDNFLMIDNKVDWYIAKKTCKKYNMKLPSLEEFRQIPVDEYRRNKRYWTSTSLDMYGTYVFGQGFHFDKTSFNKASIAYVLCIQ